MNKIYFCLKNQQPIDLVKVDIHKTSGTEVAKTLNMNQCKLIIIVLSILFSRLSLADSINHRYQDADYNKAVCKMMKGQTEVNLGKFGRADCVTDTYAIETEFADKWEEGVSQADRYGKGAGKRGLLVIITENPSENKFTDIARKYVLKRGMSILIKSYSTADLKSYLPKNQVCAKRSRSNICHLVNTGAYAATDHFDAYESYQDCIKSGGRAPYNVSEHRLRSQAKDAYSKGICLNASIK